MFGYEQELSDELQGVIPFATAIKFLFHYDEFYLRQLKYKGLLHNSNIQLKQGGYTNYASELIALGILNDGVIKSTMCLYSGLNYHLANFTVRFNIEGQACYWRTDSEPIHYTLLKDDDTEIVKYDVETVQRYNKFGGYDYLANSNETYTLNDISSGSIKNPFGSTLTASITGISLHNVKSVNTANTGLLCKTAELNVIDFPVRTNVITKQISSGNTKRYRLLGNMISDDEGTTGNNNSEGNTDNSNVTSNYIKSYPVKYNKLHGKTPTFLRAYETLYYTNVGMKEITTQYPFETPKPFNLRYIKPYWLYTDLIPNKPYAFNEYITKVPRSYISSNDEFTISPLGSSELEFRNVPVLPRMEYLLKLDNDPTYLNVRCSYVANVEQKQVEHKDVQFHYVDYMQSLVYADDIGEYDTTPRLYTGHNTGQVFHQGKWVYTSDQVMNSIDGYTDISTYNKIYTNRFGSKLLNLYDNINADVFTHYFLQTITIAEFPELNQRYEYKLPSLNYLFKLLSEKEPSKEPILLAFLTKTITMLLEYTVNAQYNYAKHPSSSSSVFNYLLQGTSVIMVMNDYYSNDHFKQHIAKLGKFKDDYADWNELTLKIDYFADYNNFTFEPLHTKIDGIVHYLMKQLKRVYQLNKHSTIAFNDWEGLEKLIRKIISCRYYTYLECVNETTFAIGVNGVFNRLQDDYTIYSDFGYYKPMNKSDIDNLISVNEYIPYSLQETLQ